MSVGSGTAASGNGDVAKCGDVTGSTFILKGQDVNPKTGVFPVDPGDAAQSGTPSDITKVIQVNLETDGACVGINLTVQLQGPDGTNLVGGTGSCEVFAGGGLGFNEVSTGDNTDGCTVVLASEQSVSVITELLVTEN